MSRELTDQWVECQLVRFPDGEEEMYIHFLHVSNWECDAICKDVELWANNDLYEEFRDYDVGEGVDFKATVTGWNPEQRSYPEYVDFPAWYDLEFKPIPSEQFTALRSMNQC